MHYIVLSGLYSYSGSIIGTQRLTLLLLLSVHVLLGLLLIKRLLAHIVEITLDPQECVVHEFVVFQYDRGTRVSPRVETLGFSGKFVERSESRIDVLLQTIQCVREVLLMKRILGFLVARDHCLIELLLQVWIVLSQDRVEYHIVNRRRNITPG